jgi:O-succinylbenzoate synthase
MTLNIDKVYLWKINLRYVEPFETSFGKEKYKRTIIVGLKSGDLTGYGELVAGHRPNFSYETIDTSLYIFKKYLVRYVMNKAVDPRKFTEEVRWIRGHQMAKAAFEMAVWDLYSKHLNKPLYKIIGGVRKRIEAGVSIGIQKNVNVLLRKIGEYLDKGYRRIKIKIKKGWDYNVLNAVRREYPDIGLTVDANAAYDKNDITYLKKLDEYNLLFIEQPLYYWDLYYHSILQSNLKTPICLDESITNGLRAEEAIFLDATRVINVKPGRVGGIVETLYINEVGLKNNVPMWIGGMLETGIGRGFNVSLATLENVKFPSDISESSRYFEKDIVVEPWTLNKDGTISVRDRPGIGVEIDWNFFYKKVLKEWIFSS